MKVGVLGLGSIGMRHAANLKQLGQDVVAHDPALEKDGPIDDWRRREHAIDRLGVTLWGREQIFEESDAVVSATPTHQHLADLQSAVEHGVPILIEKPIADEIGITLLSLLKEAENDELPVMVGYMLRFRQPAIAAKGWIDKGIIGQVLWGSFTCAQLNERYGDSVVLNWSHEIDLALYLLGPAVVDCATLRRRGRVDIADINLVHDNGAHSTIHLDYVTRPELRESIIVGSKGIIRVNFLASGWAIVDLGPSSRTVHQPEDSFDQSYITEMKAFLRRAERKPAFGATAKDGLAALKICQDVLAYIPHQT